MTGWQGNDQGGWNQQPGPYGPDPYQQQDPYGQGFDYGFGPDPYATPQYQTGAFPAAYEQPPPKRSKTPMVLSLIAIVLIVGAVVTIVLLNRKTDPTPTAADETSSSSAKPADPTSREQPPAKEGWQLIDNTEGSGLVYEVPADWKPSDEKPDSGLGVPFTGLAEYGTFDCDGGSFTRAFATSASVQGKEGAELDLAKTVQDFGNGFARVAFNEGAQVTAGQPTEVKVGDADGLMITSKVVPQVTSPNCQATESEVGVVGVVLEQDGKPAAVALLVVVNDLVGGPADPPPLAASVTQEILASVRVG